MWTIEYCMRHNVYWHTFNNNTYLHKNNIDRQHYQRIHGICEMDNANFEAFLYARIGSSLCCYKNGLKWKKKLISSFFSLSFPFPWVQQMATRQSESKNERTGKKTTRKIYIIVFINVTFYAMLFARLMCPRKLNAWRNIWYSSYPYSVLFLLDWFGV